MLRLAKALLRIFQSMNILKTTVWIQFGSFDHSLTQMQFLTISEPSLQTLIV